MSTCAVIATCPARVSEAIDTIRVVSEYVDLVYVIDDTGQSSVKNYSLPNNSIILDNRRRLGLSKSLSNWFFRYAGHDYIFRVDAGDILHPYRFHKQTQFLTDNPQYSMIGCRSLLDFTTITGSRFRYSSIRLPEILLEYYLYLKNPFVHGSICIRGETLRLVGGYKGKYSSCQDLELYLRLSRHGKLAMIQMPLHIHHFYNTSTTLSRIEENLRNTISIRAEHYPKNLIKALLTGISISYYRYRLLRLAMNRHDNTRIS